MPRTLGFVAFALAFATTGCLASEDEAVLPEDASLDDEDALEEDESGSSGDPFVDEDIDELAAVPDPLAVGGDRFRMAVSTSAHGSTTCYLPSDGIPRCMGSNGSGLLGNGSVESVITDTPAPVIVLDRVRTIAGQDNSFFALRSDGTLWTWGGSTPTPTQVPTADRFRAMTFNGNSTCVVRIDGRAMCEGGNTHGQIGDGTTNSSQDVFRLVSNLTGVVGVSMGHLSTCAVRAAGDVWCWGHNDLGQLGTGDTENSLVPVQVQGIAGAVAVVSKNHSRCALLESGGVSCWGENIDHALGTGSAIPAWTSTPLPVADVSDAVRITASPHGMYWRRQFCVARVNGRVTCWGGEFGPPTEHPTLTDVAQLVVSERYEITALLTDGTAVRTGVDNDSTLTPVPDLETGLAAPRVTTGSRHSCVLRSDGTVACWGENSQGELGNGSTLDRNRPDFVEGLSGVIDIASAASHTCAVLRDGTARCWGRNDDDQLGDGGAASPYATTPVAVAGLDDIVAIAPNDDSTCALREGGEVYCWGDNAFGQLGDGSLVDHAVPERVTDLSDAVAIAGEAGHYCAIRANGNTRCWGVGFSGELGNGQGDDSRVPVTVQTNIFSWPNDMIAIAAGNAASCAVRASGSAYCWGDDAHGLGNGAAGADQVYAQVVSNISSALDVAMGRSAQCVLLATGTVRCFGSNTYGELGDASAALGTDQSLPRTVGSFLAPLTGVVALDSGYDHSCAMQATGAVKCWGRNSSGQLGDSTWTNRSSPVTVVGLH